MTNHTVSQSVDGRRYRCAACDGAKCEHTMLCQALSTLVKEMEGLKEIPPYPNASNGYARELPDREVAFNAGISAAVGVVKKMGV